MHGHITTIMASYISYFPRWPRLAMAEPFKTNLKPFKATPTLAHALRFMAMRGNGGPTRENTHARGVVH